MDKHYDVIVIGAGNGGLAAAATTARAGCKTLLLEKNRLPGGCATSFRRGRFEFESALHELCGVGTAARPGAVYRLFDELGARIDWQYEDTLFRAVVKGKDGYDVTLRAGADAFCGEMEAAVPGCRESVRAFLAMKPKLDAAMEAMRKNGGRAKVLELLLKHRDFLRMASHSVEEVMDWMDIPKRAQDILSTYWCYIGVPTDELNALHFLNLLMGYVQDGAAMSPHRSHELSLALADAIVRHGGELRLGSKVTELLFDDAGRAVGVTANGEALYAKEIVSNVMPTGLFRMCDAENIPERDGRLVSAREMGMSFVTVYLGLDCTAAELGLRDYTVFIMSDPDPRVQYERRLDGGCYVVNCLNNAIADSSPAGTCTLFFTIPFLGSDMPDDLRPEDYKSFKNRIAQKYIEDAEDTLGISIRPRIEQIAVATPATFARYLGTPEGTVYGYRCSAWDNVVARTYCEEADHTIPGLSFCGGHYIHGNGFSVSYAMGAAAGRRAAARVKGGD